MTLQKMTCVLEYFYTDGVWFARLGEFLVGFNTLCFLWACIDWSFFGLVCFLVFFF